MEIKPIPAFYCCYLLRSTVRHASTYIGSTPDPARRLGQHNGRVKGGAARTSRSSLRPWEMGCIVAGFPSNIAALQFEWAWTNAHLTRHISLEQRISFATTRSKTPKAGKVAKRPGRPRSSLIERLSNLHLLLRVPYFSKWPLEVRFFSEDMYRSWTTWCGRVDTHIRPGIKVILDPAQPREEEEDEISSAQPQATQRRKRRAELIGTGGPHGVDPTYARLRSVFEKSNFLLDDGDDQKCSLCAANIDLHKSLFVICHMEHCQSISHVTCLADASLQRSQSASSIVPDTAACPSCTKETPWVELMRQVTLRNRGVKEVKKLLSRKGKKSTAAVAAEIMDTYSEDSDSECEEEPLTAKHVVDEGYQVSSDDDDELSVASADSFVSGTSDREGGRRPGSVAAAGERPKVMLERVIEDSEDET
ncbi:hypothetical protein PV04_04629 [Phialophora macrospora]|uniref:GIY-YIG domain-containing protein n=1 Tax=Phialophora macrospora TaxID=1851006 RepID=A0A0D2FQ50_9EURO|nr:hypothetical protein PV04_04629 [Phialophora macrospora]